MRARLPATVGANFICTAATRRREGGFGRLRGGMGGTLRGAMAVTQCPPSGACHGSSGPSGFARMKTFLLASLAFAVSATAADKIKVLIVDGQNNHQWKMTSPVLKQILEEPGIFSVDVSTSPEKGKGIETWKPKFSDYAVVVSNYNGEPWSAETKQA